MGRFPAVLHGVILRRLLARAAKSQQKARIWPVTNVTGVTCVEAATST
jgi:hypothetical protein